MVVFFKTGNQVNYFILIQRIFNSFLLRSHVFEIRERPTKLENNKIINLNVRGKRGNIVQVYPAVEYDFVPNKLEISKDDYVHIQYEFLFKFKKFLKA